MKLFSTCPHCKHENSFRTFASDRKDVAMEKGETAKLQCGDCQQEYSFEIDDLIPEVDYRFIVISSAVIYFTALLLNYVFLILTDTSGALRPLALLVLPLAFAYFFYKTELNRVAKFDHSRKERKERKKSLVEKGNHL